MLRAAVVAISVGMLLTGAGKAAGQSSGYQVVSVASGGIIKGTVKWSGPEPHLSSFPITKDPQICDPNSHKTRDLERLIIGPQGGVANTVVFIKNISSGKAFDLPPGRRSLDQHLCRNEPHILLVPERGALQMKSSDATLHTVHMDGSATYNLPFPFQNQTISRDMNTAGLVNLKWPRVDECRDVRGAFNSTYLVTSPMRTTASAGHGHCTTNFDGASLPPKDGSRGQRLAGLRESRPHFLIRCLIFGVN